MEIPLCSQQTVHFLPCLKSTVFLPNGTQTLADVRKVLPADKVPVTRALLEDLYACRLSTKLSAGSSIGFGTIRVGLKTRDDTERKDFLVVGFESDLVLQVFGESRPQILHVRIDIGNPATSNGAIKLMPKFSSQFFTFQKGLLVGPLKKLECMPANLPNETKTAWLTSENIWTTQISVSLIVPRQQKLYLGKVDKYSLTAKMLADQLFCDATILVGNDKKLKCHRSVLAANSSVFAAMIASDSTDAKTGVLELPELSESTVRVLLKYIYTRETEDAVANSSICLDLLKAGRRYAISYLENTMSDILLDMDADWYSVDVALGLYLFAREMSRNWLKHKALRILKGKFNELEELPAYRNLFHDDDSKEILMELNRYFATDKCSSAPDCLDQECFQGSLFS